MKKIFLTSGAGYICSHVVKDARRAWSGYDVLVYNNQKRGVETAKKVAAIDFPVVNAERQRATHRSLLQTVRK